MKVTYNSRDGSAVYEIEADRHGSYTVRHEGRVVKRVTAVTQYMDRPRWGSRKLELAAIEDAKAAIESHHAVRS